MLRKLLLTDSCDSWYPPAAADVADGAAGVVAARTPVPGLTGRLGQGRPRPPVTLALRPPPDQ